MISAGQWSSYWRNVMIQVSNKRTFPSDISLQAPEGMRTSAVIHDPLIQWMEEHAMAEHAKELKSHSSTGKVFKDSASASRLVPASYLDNKNHLPTQNVKIDLPSQLDWQSG